MTFLNPIFPWALAALAIPVIIHLFNFRRPKKVLFSNLSLVKEVQKTVVRRLKLKQWLILAARLLAVLCLLFVFANPVIPGKNSDAAKAGRHSVAIVIDDSYSMSAGNENGAYFLQAKKIAAEILMGFPRENEFLVMPLSSLKYNYAFGAPEDAKTEIDNLKVHENLNGMKALMTNAPRIFGKARYPGHSLFLISDFQQSTLLPDSLPAKADDPGLSVTLLPLATREQKNMYVQDHEILTRIIEPGKPVTLKMKLVNDGSEAVKDLGIQVNLEGKAIAISTQDAGPGEQKEVEISFTPPGTGWQSGYIELDDNPVDFDNRRFFSFYVPEKEKVLIVEEEASDALHLVYSQLLTQFSPEFISFRNFSSARLEDYKFIALVGFNDISSGMSEQLLAYLDEGHSVLFCPGEKAQPEGLNRFLTPAKVGVIGERVQIEKGVPASQPDLQHPVFAEVFKRSKKESQFDAPIVYQYYKLSPDNSVVQNRILGLANQDVLLLETRSGNGLVYTFTALPDKKWTDLPYKALFSPLILRLSLLMNQTQNVQQNQQIGNFSPKKIKTREKDPVMLRSREGQELIPEWYSSGGYIDIDFQSLQDLKEGNFDLLQQGKMLEKISFNIPDAESKLKCAGESALREYVSAHNLSQVTVSGSSTADLAGELRAQVEGTPLWKYFLIAAILFFLTEVVLLRFRD